MLNFLLSFRILQIFYFELKIIPEIYLSEASCNKEKFNSLLLHRRSKQEQNPTINTALGVFQTK